MFASVFTWQIRVDSGFLQDQMIRKFSENVEMLSEGDCGELWKKNTPLQQLCCVNMCHLFNRVINWEEWSRMEIKNICKLEYSEVCSKTIEQFDRTEMVLNLFHSFVSSVLIHKTNSST